MPGSQAMYARVAARLREEVRDGMWPLGAQLPGEIDLAARYGVARATVVRALEVLRGEGVVVTRAGAGTRVAAIPAVITVRLAHGDWAMARLPEDDEAERLGLSPGVPVLVIRRAGAGPPELHDASVTRVACH